MQTKLRLSFCRCPCAEDSCWNKKKPPHSVLCGGFKNRIRTAVKSAYLPSISWAVLQMVAASRPNFFSRSHAGPEQPNTSCTPTRRTGVGSFSLRTAQTLRPDRR